MSGGGGGKKQAAARANGGPAVFRFLHRSAPPTDDYSWKGQLLLELHDLKSFILRSFKEAFVHVVKHQQTHTCHVSNDDFIIVCYYMDNNEMVTTYIVF